MAKTKTAIEWADWSLNPYGHVCTKRSPGCQNCYMMAMAKRFGEPDPTGAFYTRWDKAYKELAAMPSGAVIFVNSMSDTYYEKAPDRDVHRVHNMALAHPDKTFLILTKRPERPYFMRHLLAWPDNLWLGVSVESEDYLWRIDLALLTGAKHVFVSFEPLLGAIHGLEKYLPSTLTGVTVASRPGIFRLAARDSGEALSSAGNRAAWGRGWHWSTKLVEWVIVGGESGGKRRPFDKAWAREIRDVCVKNDVPFMFKQGAAYHSGQDRDLDGRMWDEAPFTEPTTLPHKVTLYTARISPAHVAECERRGVHFLDTTVKSAGWDGVPFAPTWEMVNGIKSGLWSEQRYTEAYTALMRESYIKHRDVWERLLRSHDAVALGCYCAPGAFCHRHLLADILRKVGEQMGLVVEMGGEIEPSQPERTAPEQLALFSLEPVAGVAYE